VLLVGFEAANVFVLWGLALLVGLGEVFVGSVLALADLNMKLLKTVIITPSTKWPS
jgi:hypothetical protein